MKINMMLALALAAGVAVADMALAQTAPVPPKAATAATKAANQQVLQTLPFGDKSDFEDARRGFMGAPETLTIKNAAGTVVWDLENYKKFIALDKPAPNSVNPSLWRNAQLNMQYGLFKVTDRILRAQIALHTPRPLTASRPAFVVPGRLAIRCAVSTSRTSRSSKATPAGSCSIP